MGPDPRPTIHRKLHPRPKLRRRDKPNWVIPIVTQLITSGTSLMVAVIGAIVAVLIAGRAVGDASTATDEPAQVEGTSITRTTTPGGPVVVDCATTEGQVLVHVHERDAADGTWSRIALCTTDPGG